jgi:hypothetical protein
MLSWNCRYAFVWPMYAWYSMLGLSHLAWRARVRWNIMVLWLLGRTSIQTRISAEKVSEFDSLYFVHTSPLWVISVYYLFQRIGTHQLHPSMALSHWTLSQVMVTKLIRWSCKASTCVCETLCICLCVCVCVCVCERERERHTHTHTHTQNFFELLLIY